MFGFAAVHPRCTGCWLASKKRRRSLLRARREHTRESSSSIHSTSRYSFRRRSLRLRETGVEDLREKRSWEQRLDPSPAAPLATVSRVVFLDQQTGIQFQTGNRSDGRSRESRSITLDSQTMLKI